MALKSNLIQDQSGNIYYRKMIRGNRVIIPTYTKKISIANKLHSALEYQALIEHYSPKERKRYKSFNQLVELYLKDNNVLIRWTGQTKSVAEYILRKYAKTKKIPHNRESARTYQIRINALLNWAEKKNYITDIKKMAIFPQKARQRVFTHRELNIIMNEFQDDNFQNFVRFAYYTGARRGEINSLKPNQIEPTQLKVKGKTGHRLVKLNAQARTVLMEQDNLWNYKADFITKKFKKNSRNLEIKDARFHDLRRTFGLNLIKSGMPIFKVSKLLGHSSVKITEQHYAPLLVSDIEDFTI